MVHYRRYWLPGGTFFFTATLADRRSRMLTERIEHLRRAFRLTRQERPFEIVAIVVLPDHLHTIWILPDKDTDYPGRWRAIKARFTHGLAANGAPIGRGGEGGLRLWQPRYWEHAIRDDRDLQSHVDYIHYNPVKHGFVPRVCEWPHSSFHRYVRQGWLPVDWGGDEGVVNGAMFGE